MILLQTHGVRVGLESAKRGIGFIEVRGGSFMLSVVVNMAWLSI